MALHEQPDPARWLRVAALSDLAATRKHLVAVAGLEILLIHSGGEIYAVRNRCTHLGQSLERGRLMSGQITCPFHNACFDLKTGKAISGPAVTPLQAYAARVENGEIFLDLAGQLGKAALGQ